MTKAAARRTKITTRVERVERHYISVGRLEHGGTNGRVGYQTALRVGVQHFNVGPVYDKQEEAVWFGSMLAKALDRLVAEIAG